MFFKNLIFLTVFLVVSSGCTNANKSDNGKQGATSAGAISTSDATNSNKEPDKEIVTTPKDTTLAGIDIALNLEEFKKKYADKIKECKADVYKLEVTNDATVPVIVCSFKLNEESEVRFYNGKIYFFISPATGKNIKLRLAAEELAKKSGHPTELTTFSGSFAAYCAATTPFHEGDASLISDNIMTDLVELRQRGIRQESCSEDIYINKEWASVRYDNTNLKEKMKTVLIQERDKAERSAAGNIKL